MIKIQLEDQCFKFVTANKSTEASAFNASNGILRFAMDTACSYKTVKTKINFTKRVWDAESRELKRSYLEALN